MATTTIELRDTKGYTESELRFLCRQAALEIEKRDELILSALERLRAASMPLGMTIEQFNAMTILETQRLLTAHE